MNSDPDTHAEVVLKDGAIAADVASAPRIRPIGSREFASTLITNVVIQACTVVQGLEWVLALRWPAAPDAPMISRE